ncbi:MAG: HisA/HisF-related TIM barrel protein [Steroidobacteraceae bacterium]
MELYPAIDVRQGRVVRLFRGDFRVETRYRKSPEQLLRQFAKAGARRVHVVDLEGARKGRAGDASLIQLLAKHSSVRLQAGGGVRKTDDVSRCLDAGAERVVTGSVAVHSPTRLAEWIRRFGRERIVAALDVRIDDRGTPRLVSRGWKHATRLSLWRALVRLEAAGLKHVICTDVARDGTLAGPNVDLYRECVRRFPFIAWQASGGIRDARDLQALAATGIDAAIAGKALLERRIPQRELVPFLPAA